MTERKTITDLTCKNAKARDTKYEVADSTRAGFRLLVQPSGAKSLIFRYTSPTTGFYRNLHLAKYAADGNVLAIALERYRTAVDALARKEDPKDILDPKHDADATVTAHVTRYKEARKPEWSDSTQYVAGLELEHMTDDLGSKAIKVVTRKDVQKVIDKAAKRGPAAEVSCWKWVRAFFQWAYDRDDIAVNPAEKIKRPHPDTERDRYLDDHEIKIVWQAATDAGGPPGALVKLILLTACRRREITHLKRVEIQGEEIVIPGRGVDRKTKNRKMHRIPITPMIRSVLDNLPKTGKYIVTGGDEGLGGHTKARAKIKTPNLDDNPWTYHDLRRSVATGMAKLGVHLAVTEKCLNQSSGQHAKRLVRIYQHHDHAEAVKAAFELWSDHIASLVGEEKMEAAA